MSFSPTPPFRFDGYAVRPITEQDRPYLGMKIDADQYHREKVEADFFLKPLPGESSWALEDAEGRVVFYFKNSPVIRMHIQFTAEGDLDGKRRNMNALMRGLAWIEGVFRATRFREILFDVDGPELKEFAKRRLGFTGASDLLSRTISPYEGKESQPRTVGTVPTDGLERAG